jgi:signal transduction histidine kinase
MLDYLRNLLNDSELTPHGFCLLWRPEIIWTHVTSDAIIALSYFSIPAAIAYFLTKRDDIAFKPVAWAFVLFITACGGTHLMAIVTLWKPYYGAEGLVKALTALVSIVTASALWKLMPIALAWPSPKQLRAANDELHIRIRERDDALAALQREVAARTEIEQKLRHSQKMEAIGQLTGGVAHDFNNLMTIILNNLERATRLVDDKEKCVKAIRGAQDGASRAATLTKQLLVFSRRQTTRPEKTSISAALKDAVALSKNLLTENVHLHLDLDETLPDVVFDVNEAANAVMNLIANARDAMPDGGDVWVISRMANAPGKDKFIEVSVMDDGCGMSQDVVDHAFEPFFTTKAVGYGSGLGLSQVYGFATQAGGHVEISSAPGEGTSVSIFIPVGV